MISYALHPEPTHVNAPDAWAVWRTTRTIDPDGGERTEVDLIAHGIGLADALDEIKADHELAVPGGFRSTLVNGSGEPLTDDQADAGVE